MKCKCEMYSPDSVSTAQPNTVTPTYTPTAQKNTVTPRSLLDVNFHCLLKIFGMLEQRDMVTASSVCHGFQDLATTAFKYEWRNRIIRLTNISTDTKLESTAILRQFANQLRKVEIVFGNFGNEIFFKYFVDKCDSQLTEVKFSSSSMNTHSEAFLSKENIHQLNVKFQNLKKLQFAVDITEPECIEQHFPALQELRLDGYPFENRNIRQFVMLNPQVKILSSFHGNDVHDAVDMISSIDQHAPQLEELGCRIYGPAEKIVYQPRFLKNLRRLKILNNGNSTNLKHLAISNEKLTEMKLSLCCCDEETIDFICQYKELTKLDISTNTGRIFDSKHLSKLKKHLPKLTEIKISTFWNELNSTHIVQFLHGYEQLVTLTLEDHAECNISTSMDEIREKLDSTRWTVSCIAPNRELHFVRTH